MMSQGSAKRCANPYNYLIYREEVKQLIFNIRSLLCQISTFLWVGSWISILFHWSILFFLCSITKVLILIHLLWLNNQYNISFICLTSGVSWLFLEHCISTSNLELTCQISLKINETTEILLGIVFVNRSIWRCWQYF